MGIAIAAIVGLVIVVFAVGFFSVGGLSAAQTGNDNVAGCAAACANLLAKRAQVCRARAAVAAARSTRDSWAIQAAAAVATSIAASALAAASAVACITSLPACAV